MRILAHFLLPFGRVPTDIECLTAEADAAMINEDWDFAEAMLAGIDKLKRDERAARH